MNAQDFATEALRLLPALVALAGEAVAEPDFEQAHALLKRAKARMTGSALAAALGLSVAELETFEGLLRDLIARDRAKPASPQAERNHRIAVLRFLDFCTLIANRLGHDELEPRLPAPQTEEGGRKQLRALELLLRSLVGESYGDQHALRAGLAALYGEEQVSKWESAADKGDLLSGTVFSELASLFVNKKEYPNRYSGLFDQTPYLDFLREKRKTLQTFLEDIRRFRNLVAHNKRVGPVQLALLDLYYDELVRPVDEAHAQGRTKVDPKVFLHVGKEDLDSYFAGLREDLVDIKDDLGLLKSVTKAIDERTVFISLGVKILLALAAIGALFAAWEVALYFYNRWENRLLAARYADVAEEIYYRENNPEVANTLLNRAIDLEEQNPRFRTLKAYIDGMAAVRELLNLERPLAKDELDRAHFALANAAWLEKLDAKAAQPHILRAQIYVALSQFAEAEQALLRAIALDPDNDFAYMRLGALKQSQNDADGAFAMLDKALAINPSSKWAWLWKGVVSGLNLDQWDKARAAYAKALELDPRFDMAHYNIAWSYMQARPRDYAKARASLEQALRINPNYKEALYALGMVYGYQDQYEAARTYLTKALALDPRYVTAWKWRGRVNDDDRRYDDALADFAKAIELAPGDAEIYVFRARVSRRTEQYDRAVADLTFASGIDPDNFLIWMYLGEVYALSREPVAAIANFDKALALKPDAEIALAGRAEARAELGEHDAAARDFDAAVSAAKYRPERILRKRAAYRLARGQWDQALADYRAARQAEPRDFTAWLAEARLLAEHGRWDEAAIAIEACFRLKPQDAEAAKLKRALRAQHNLD